MAISAIGSDNAAEIHNRRVIVLNSVSSVATDASTGSSAMPQIGQLPGPTWRICGCIGQV